MRTFPYRPLICLTREMTVSGTGYLLYLARHAKTSPLFIPAPAAFQNEIGVIL